MTETAEIIFTIAGLILTLLGILVSGYLVQRSVGLLWPKRDRQTKLVAKESASRLRSNVVAIDDQMLPLIRRFIETAYRSDDYAVFPAPMIMNGLRGFIERTFAKPGYRASQLKVILDLLNAVEQDALRKSLHRSAREVIHGARPPGWMSIPAISFIAVGGGGEADWRFTVEEPDNLATDSELEPEIRIVEFGRVG